MKIPRILAIVGPTASGKTPVSLLVAEMFDGEIVSADSRQIYKYLDIGTAKPTRLDMHRVTHHFVDVLDPREGYSAGQFGQDAAGVIKDILRRGKVPILVGGSGLYLKAAIDGMFDEPGKDPDVRANLEAQYRAEGIEPLIEMLRKVDPAALAKMREVTPRRVVRALEVFVISGKPLSQYHQEQKSVPGYATLQFGLEWKRKDLYERIDRRTDQMIVDGLVEEVKSLKAKGYDRHLNALNTVGYKEVFDFLDGASDHERMVALIKQNSRRFAKRQVTWFKADTRIRRIEMTRGIPVSDVAHRIVREFKK